MASAGHRSEAWAEGICWEAAAHVLPAMLWACLTASHLQPLLPDVVMHRSNSPRPCAPLKACHLGQSCIQLAGGVGLVQLYQDVHADIAAALPPAGTARLQLRTAGRHHGLPSAGRGQGHLEVRRQAAPPCQPSSGDISRHRHTSLPQEQVRAHHSSGRQDAADTDAHQLPCIPSAGPWLLAVRQWRLAPDDVDAHQPACLPAAQ